MKTLLILCLAALAATSPCFAQTKTATAKKPVGKVISKPKLDLTPPTSLTASTAGKFAKDFAQRMYNSIDFEAQKSTYTLSINKWKPYKITQKDGTEATWYMIDVTIKWQSAGSGWPTQWKDVEYNGLIICDEFGCEPNILITTKIEPSSKGLAALVVKGSPVGVFTAEEKPAIEALDPWFVGVNYVWNPGGCLNE